MLHCLRLVPRQSLNQLTRFDCFHEEGTPKLQSLLRRFPAETPNFCKPPFGQARWCCPTQEECRSAADGAGQLEGKALVGRQGIIWDTWGLYRLGFQGAMQCSWYWALKPYQIRAGWEIRFVGASGGGGLVLRAISPQNQGFSPMPPRER